MLAIHSVLVILDQSESVVAFHHHVVELLQRQQASDFVHVDGHIVKGGGFSGDSQAVVVVFESLLKSLLFQESVCLLLVFSKFDSIKFSLNFSELIFDSWVCFIQILRSLEIILGSLEIFFFFIALCSPL